MEDHSLEAMASFIQKVPQIVPESWCLRCKICCRFPDTEGVQTPAWSALEADWASQASGQSAWFEKKSDSPSLTPKLHSCENGYRCPAFREGDNHCSIYSVRPLDCRLYPFVLTRNPGQTQVTLAMDTKCPYLQEHGTDPKISAYAMQLASYLEDPLALDYLETNPKIIGDSWPEFVSMAALPSMTAILQERPMSPPHLALQPLTLDQRSLLAEALAQKRHLTSSYTMAGLLGWSDLIRYWWAAIQGAFCLFAEQAGGFFMPLPPLGKKVSTDLFEEAWKILSELNQGSQVSRIEGIEPAVARRLDRTQFRLLEGDREYIYRRADLVELRGDRYRSQRWAINRFKREAPSFQIRPFQDQDLVPCLQLYTLWGIQRQQEAQESFPKALIRDGLFFHRRLMMSHRELGLTGRILEIDGRIRGYTFGAPVSARVFTIFLEITDRSLPGLNQLLFREFCREMEQYPLVNAMGDQDLPGLRGAKKTYRPVGTVTTLTVAQKWTGGESNP